MGDQVSRALAELVAELAATARCSRALAHKTVRQARDARRRSADVRGGCLSRPAPVARAER
jgi:hypothetical protein